MPVAREWRVDGENADGSAHDGAATTPLPQRLLHDQIGSATPAGRAGRPGGGGNAEGRGGPATKPRRKRFRATNELHTDQPRQEQDLPEGVAEQAECAGRVQHDLSLNNEPANLNNEAVDDEGGGGDEDRSRRGDDSAVDGSAHAAQERLLNHQIGNVTPWGRTARRGGGCGTAEGRQRSASKPRGKGFKDICVQTDQVPEGVNRCAVAEKPEIEAMIAPLPLRVCMTSCSVLHAPLFTFAPSVKLACLP